MLLKKNFAEIQFLVVNQKVNEIFIGEMSSWAQFLKILCDITKIYKTCLQICVK